MGPFFTQYLWLCELGGGIVAAALVVMFVLNRVETKAEVIRPGMHGVIGRFGGGKSYFLAWVAARAQASGREVWANIRIKGCRYFASPAEFMRIPNGAVILVDEAHLVFPVSVRWLPEGVEERLSQLRHHGQVLFWATQHWTMVNPRLRKLCFTVWLAQSWSGGHQYTQFTGSTFPMNGRVPRIQRGGGRSYICRMKKRRRRSVEQSYDTHEDVDVTEGWAVRGRRSGRAPVSSGVAARHEPAGAPATAALWVPDGELW